jgi:hypothetical protein
VAAPLPLEPYQRAEQQRDEEAKQQLRLGEGT